MNRRTILAACGGVIVTGCLSTNELPGAGLLTGSTRGSSTDHENFPMYLAHGTSSLLEALASMNEAVAINDVAEKLRLSAAAMQGGTISEDSFRDARELIATHPVERDMLAAADVAVARQHVGKASLFAGFGIFFDNRALAAAKGAMGGGLSMASLGGQTDLAMLAVQAVPTHVRLGQDILSQARNYMVAHAIPLPTKDEQLALASEMFGDSAAAFDFPA